jgi:hypothetical protein
MRVISFRLALVLLSSAAFAQPLPGTPTDKLVGETIGHPPPLPGPPPASEPSKPPAANSTPSSQSAPKGYTGAYGPPGPATPYYTGPPPEVFASTGRSVEGPNNTTLIVKAVPCTGAARSTDGTTTCVGIPDSFKKSAR